MVKRIVLEVVLILVLTILLAWTVLAGLALRDSADPVGTVVDQTPRVLFGLLGIALGLWTLLLIIGAIVHRRRAAGWRRLHEGDRPREQSVRLPGADAGHFALAGSGAGAGCLRISTHCCAIEMMLFTVQ